MDANDASNGSTEPAGDELELLRGVLERQQFFAWDVLGEAVIEADGGEALRPETSGRALRTLLDLLEHSTPISVDRIDVEVLASGLYQAVMERAGLTPDPRLDDPVFRAHASLNFDTGAGKTLWDSPIVSSDVLDRVRNFTGRDVAVPNLAHSEEAH